jgi:DNA-binding MurR/RpiR family transcriptional regulator
MTISSFLSTCAVDPEPGGSGADHLQTAGAEDLLIVVSIRPYARASLALTEFAAARGVPVVVLTDSLLSPVSPHAIETLVVGVESPSFFHSMVPAFATIEVLAALVAAALGDRALDALKDRERLFDALDIMVDRGSRGTASTDKAKERTR